MKTVVICDKDIIVRENLDLLDEDDYEKLKSSGCLGEEIDCFEEIQNDMRVYGIDSVMAVPAGYKKLLLREYYANFGAEGSFIPFRAKGLFEWRKECKFCGSCGSVMKNHLQMTARVCSSCGKMVFPRISPCIIICIKKDGKILLAKHTYRNQDRYVCIAGFMESGESVEQAVRREVFEETGLKIKNLIYRGSQSWPFSDQLMLGFTADWESGDIVLQKEELSDAQWFSHDNLPNSPNPGSIAYELIHKWSKMD